MVVVVVVVVLVVVVVVVMGDILSFLFGKFSGS